MMSINGMENAREYLNRPVFNLAQRIQATRTGLVTDEHRKTRPVRVTHAIDNLPPDVQSDRDDGIFVEKTDRGYRVHVTIADVAAHVPPDTPLAKAAHQRAFTLYRIPRKVPAASGDCQNAETEIEVRINDPMFPDDLEKRMSLEHDMECLGLSVIIDLDDTFQPIHTEFERVIAKPDNVDYKGAAERTASDQPFKLMHEVAKGLRRNLFNQTDDLWKDQDEVKPGMPNLTREERAAFKNVETFMILANSAVAEFFNQTSLPFIYRNFDDSTQVNGIERAAYATQTARHKDMEKHGIKHYCHFTSPIRRGPDFYNGHMVHYVADIVERIEAFANQAWPEANRDEMHRTLWRHVGGIADKLVASQQENTTLSRLRFEGELNQWLKTHLQPLPHSSRDAFRRLSGNLQAMRPPFEVESLEAQTAHINELVYHERLMRAQASKQEQKSDNLDKQLNKAQQRGWKSMEKAGFHSALDNAAFTGKLPYHLAVEVRRRIQSGKKCDINLAQAALAIMVVAQYPHDTRWRVLKREITKKIKHDPVIINSVMEMALDKGYISREHFDVKEVSLAVDSDQALPEEDKNIRAALAIEYGHQDGKPDLAAPYYSVGHDIRSARSHAVFSFLESLAFGDLVPLDRAAIPNLLYAELERKEISREDLVRKMIEPIGATLHIHTDTAGDKFVTTVQVCDGTLSHPIRYSSDAESLKEDARENALKRLLRDTSFKRAVGAITSEELHQAVYPQHELEKHAMDKGWEMHIEASEAKKSGPEQHCATLTIHGASGGISRFQAARSSRQKAINAACVQALRAFDLWKFPHETGASAWVVGDDDADPGPPKPHKPAPVNGRIMA